MIGKNVSEKGQAQSPPSSRAKTSHSTDMKPNQTAQQTTTALPKESFIDLLDKYLLVPSQTLKWSQILGAQR